MDRNHPLCLGDLSCLQSGQDQTASCQYRLLRYIVFGFDPRPVNSMDAWFANFHTCGSVSICRSDRTLGTRARGPSFRQAQRFDQEG